MKIKNIAAGDFVQIKKSLCHSEFKAKQVCEVIDTDPTDKYGFDVLIQGKNCLDWVNHKDLKKPIKREPEPQLKQLDQSVFNGLDEKWRWFGVNSDGSTIRATDKPKINVSNNGFILLIGDSEFFDDNYDASNWQNSLIKRDTAKELLEVDLSSELTGSELCKAMLARGDKFILCGVSDSDDSDAANHEDDDFLAEAVTDFDDTDGLFGTTSMRWNHAVPINNQGEPLTQAEAGL